MDVTKVGALGIDYLKSIESMRAKSRNLHGGISGKIRKNLQNTTDIINTLIYKVTATGDPAKLKIENRALMDQIEKLKLEEIIRKREMDEMKQIVDKLKNEVDELKDKLDEMEVDRNKARSQRIAEWKMRKALVAVGNKDFDEEAPMDIEVTDVTRRRNIPRENETRIKTSNILVDFEEKTDLVSSVEALTGTGDENEGKVKSNDKYRRNEELDKIQKQIKELIKRKKEIKKDEVMQKDKNIKEVQDEERPLPQRIPRVKPRVLSNVQLIPLRKNILWKIEVGLWIGKLERILI